MARNPEKVRALELKGTELSLSIVHDDEIRNLNRDFRGKDKATDVLSFPQGLAECPSDQIVLLGDIVISWTTALRMAEQQGVKTRDELKLYLAHGLLHLLGYDHLREADRKKMASKEAWLLGTAGMIGRSYFRSKAKPARQPNLGRRRTTRSSKTA
jgi:probable rRNA maturation factor